MKKDFPLLKDGLVYLDSSATAQKPAKVIEAVKKYYENDNANIHRGIYRLAQKSTMLYEQAHEIVADFIGAEPEEVIFTKGTTEGLNLLAYSLGKDLKAGDEIVLTEMEHHSNLVPWQQIAKEKGAAVKFIPVTKEYRLDLAKAQELITAKTKIVSVVHMSNVLGTINPVKEIAAMAHKAGAIIIVDAAQSVPHLKIDVQGLDCDFLAFSGHKMCAPTGIGVLYGRKKILETMHPFLYGGDMISEVTFEDSTWNQLPWKFEAGTPNLAGAAGLAAAIGYLQEIGMENIAAQGQKLTEYALKKLSAVPGLTIVGPADTEERGAVISFNIEGMHPHDLSERLDEENIAVRGGFHCAMPLFSRLGLDGSIRASFYIYNTAEDVDRLVEALMKISGDLKCTEFSTQSKTGGVKLRTLVENSGTQKEPPRAKQASHRPLAGGGRFLFEKETDAIDKDEIASTDLTEEQELYKENVLDHYKHPRNKREMADPTAVQKEVNPLCGDVLTLYVKTEDDKIADASFTGSGCAVSQASASLLTEHIKGKTVKEAAGLNSAGMFGLLGIPISPARTKCALLSLKALHQAVRRGS